MEHPLVCLASAIHSATLQDLHPVPEKRPRPGAVLPKGAWQWPEEDLIEVMRRPRADEVDVKLFRQSWPNTATAFDAHCCIAGQAFTDAYTVVVMGPYGDAAVYVSGMLAYTVAAPGPIFYEDMQHDRMESQRRATVSYSATMPQREG